jgi:hypothetical protein
MSALGLGSEGSLDSCFRLLLKGKLRKEQITRLLHHYFNAYVKCENYMRYGHRLNHSMLGPRGVCTKLDRGGRYVRCDQCGAQRQVPLIQDQCGAQRQVHLIQERLIRFRKKRQSSKEAVAAASQEAVAAASQEAVAAASQEAVAAPLLRLQL